MVSRATLPNSPQTFLKDFKILDIKHYMFVLLTACEHLAENGVMHRDIKPSNFLYDANTRTGLLIDFGLSELELDEKNQPKVNPTGELVNQIFTLQKKLRIRNRTGTKGYMPLESLFHSPVQTSTVDVWAAGVIFLSLLCQRHPIFTLNSNNKVKNFTIQNLIPLVCLFGSDSIKEVAFKHGYGCLIPEDMQKTRIPFVEICHHKDAQALDLLSRMLELDGSRRITAKDALKHDFFKEVRNDDPMQVVTSLR